MKEETQKEPRLVARVHPDVQEFVKNAADLSGATLSQFIIEAVTAKARQVIDNECRIKLTIEGAESVFKALDMPPQVNDKLLDAARRFNERGGFHYAKNGSTG